jgi:hypothetical protein
VASIGEKRVVVGPDEIEVATEPTGVVADVELADLVVVAGGEVRLVGVFVADRREDADLALVVERRQAFRRRVPAEPVVLGEFGPRFR